MTLHAIWIQIWLNELQMDAKEYWKFACNYDVAKIILKRHFVIAFYLRMI